jgi:hypothetical protein
MNFRILKKPKGYIVEVEVVKWSLFGLKKQWQPFIKTSGSGFVWYHKTYDYAMMNLLDEIKWQTIKNAKITSQP